MAHPIQDDAYHLDEDKVVNAQVFVNDIPGEGEGEYEESTEGEIDQAYLNASKWTRFFRGTFFQMIIFGCMAFVGPAMTDAINLLGGGGLTTPYLANLASALNYMGTCIMAFVGGPVINKLGIKWACIISAGCYVLAGSGYYAEARYGLQAYLLSARVIGGFTNALLYVAESTAMISYPHLADRGNYLGIWTAMRNSGSIIGGAINFANNHTNASAGAIAWSTYLIFVGFEASGIFFAFLLSPTAKVRRPDGTRVPTSPKMSWLQEMVALWKHLKSPRIWLMAVPSFYSFFYGGTYSTYLTLHFSVRARALSSFLTPLVTTFICLVYGRLLDNKRMSQRSRAWMSFLLWLVPQAACFIWTGINYGKWGQHKTYHAYDYSIDGAAWAEAYLPYLIVYSTGYWTQISLYWILGTFSTDVKSSARTGGLFRAFEAAGSAVTYAINTAAASDHRIPLYINCALLLITIPCMVGLIRLVPERPSEIDDVVDIETTNAVEQKADVLL